MTYIALASQLEYWHFDENVMIFTDGSFGVGIDLGGDDILCSSDERINQISQGLENLFLTLPEGMRLQIDYRCREEADFSSHLELQRKDDPKFLEFSAARLAHFEERKQLGLIVSKDCRLFLRSAPYAYKISQGLRSKKAFQQVAASDYEDHKQKFLRDTEQALEVLKSTDLDPKLLSAESYFEEIYRYFNPGKDSPPPPGNDLFSPTLSEKICTTDLFVKDDAIVLNKHHHRQTSLKCLPEQSTFSGMIRCLQMIPSTFRLVVSIRVPDQQKARQALGLRRRIAFSMAVGGTGVSDLESSNSYGELEELLQDVISGRSRLMHMSMTVQLCSQDLELLEKECDAVLRSMRELGGAEGLVETLPGAQVFFKSAPGVCAGLRDKLLKSSNLAHLSPIFKPWSGNEKPVCLLRTAEDTLFGLDPFDPHLPNWNAVVFGSSGSGKSFFTSQMMLQVLSQKSPPRVVWLDNGASSKNLALAVGGAFIDLTIDSGHRINMFECGGGEPSSSRINLIMAVLEQILKEPYEKALPRSHKATLEQIVRSLYLNSETPTLSLLKEALSGKTDMASYQNILYSWTGSSNYGKILDGPTNVAIDKDITSIELGSLSIFPDLKNILLLIVTGMIEDYATSDRTRPYLCVVDESERLFQTELAREFVITCFRTWRKYGSGIWALSQNYKDFLRDENLKDSLLPNTAMMFILQQRNIDWQDFQKSLDLNDNELLQVKGLKTRKRSHSDLYFSQADRQTILKLDPDPFSYQVCTTDPNDLKN